MDALIWLSEEEDWFREGGKVRVFSCDEEAGELVENEIGPRDIMVIPLARIKEAARGR